MKGLGCFFAISLSLASASAVGRVVVDLAYSIRPPYAIAGSKGVHGLTATVANDAFSDLHIPFEWSLTPSNRQLKEVESNQKPICALGWFKTTEREKHGQFSEAIYRDRPTVALSLSSDNLVRSGETIKQVLKTPGIVLLVKDGYSYGPYIDHLINQLHPEVESVTLGNEGMLKMLSFGRADLFFVAPAEADKLIELYGHQRPKLRIIHFNDPPPGNKRYLYCSFKVPKSILGDIDHWIERNVTLNSDYSGFRDRVISSER